MANSILLPHVVRFNLDVCAERYVLVARAMGLKTEGLSHEAVGEAVADAITQFTQSIGVPQKLRDADVPEEGLVEASEVALTQGPMVFNPKWISDPEEVLGVFKKAW
jgi:alcohol dehydrogenase class IV